MSSPVPSAAAGGGGDVDHLLTEPSKLPLATLRAQVRIELYGDEEIKGVSYLTKTQCVGLIERHRKRVREGGDSLGSRVNANGKRVIDESEEVS